MSQFTPNYDPSALLPKRKGLHAYFEGVWAPFYYTTAVVQEGQPMKPAAAGSQTADRHNDAYLIQPLAAGVNDGAKCIGLALQLTYDEGILTGELAQLKGYHFANDTSQKLNGAPIGLLTGQGWALLENYGGVINAGDQLGVGPSGVLWATGLASGDKVNVWSETKSGPLWTQNRGFENNRNRPIRVRFGFQYTAANA